MEMETKMQLFDLLKPEEVLAGFKEFYANSTLVNDFVPVDGNGSFLKGKRATQKDAHLDWYFDFCSGIGCSVLGHNYSAINWALINLVQNNHWNLLPYNDWAHEQGVLLAKKLCEVTPGNFPKKVFFGNSGTEGVEAAIKACQSRRYHAGQKQKKAFCAFGGAFHGRTLGALSLNCSKKKHTEAFFADEGDLSTGTHIKHRAVPVRHLPFPEKGDEGAIADFNAILDILHWDDTNAIFLELVQGEGGIRVIDPASLQRLVKICRDEDVYLVIDEVQTGLMRTGKMFACNHYDLEPDIIILGKALGAGYMPISATVFKKEFDFKESGQHSNTFGGGPAACLVGRIVLDELEQKKNKELLIENTKILEEFIPEGLGLMRRIKFATHEEAQRVAEKSFDLRLIVIEAGHSAIRLMPPINTNPDMLKYAIKRLQSVL